MSPHFAARAPYNVKEVGVRPQHSTVTVTVHCKHSNGERASPANLKSV